MKQGVAVLAAQIETNHLILWRTTKKKVENAFKRTYQMNSPFRWIATILLEYCAINQSQTTSKWYEKNADIFPGIILVVYFCFA